VETLDIWQIARVLRVSVKTVRNRLSVGLPMPPSFVVGRQRLFLQDQVDAWLRSQPGAVLDLDAQGLNVVHERRGRPRKAGSLW
jgi:hypothetical protein